MKNTIMGNHETMAAINNSQDKTNPLGIKIIQRLGGNEALCTPSIASTSACSV